MRLNSSMLAMVVVGVVIVAGLAFYFSSGYQQAPAAKQYTEPVTELTFDTYSDQTYEYEATRYPSGAEVVEEPQIGENITIGFVVDTDNMRFGVVPSGDNFAKRFIDLENLQDKDAAVELSAIGGIQPFVKFSEQKFTLKPGQNKTVEAVFYAKDAGMGNYTGEINVVIKRRV